MSKSRTIAKRTEVTEADIWTETGLGLGLEARLEMELRLIPKWGWD